MKGFFVQKFFNYFLRIAFTLAFSFLSGSFLSAGNDLLALDMAEKSAKNDIIAIFTEIEKQLAATLDLLIEKANIGTNELNEKIETSKKSLELFCNNDKVEPAQKNMILDMVTERFNTTIDNCVFAIEKENELLTKIECLKKALV